MINVTGHFWVWNCMHMWESAYIQMLETLHITKLLFFFFLLHHSGMERLNLLCCDKSWVLYVFCIYILGYGQKKTEKKKIKIKPKQKTYKNT